MARGASFPQCEVVELTLHVRMRGAWKCSLPDAGGRVVAGWQLARALHVANESSARGHGGLPACCWLSSMSPPYDIAVILGSAAELRYCLDDVAFERCTHTVRQRRGSKVMRAVVWAVRHRCARAAGARHQRFVVES